jgi:hypothetical protein
MFFFVFGTLPGFNNKTNMGQFNQLIFQLLNLSTLQPSNITTFQHYNLPTIALIPSYMKVRQAAADVDMHFVFCSVKARCFIIVIAGFIETFEMIV